MSLKSDDQYARRIADAIGQAAKLGGEGPRAEAIIDEALEAVLRDLLDARCRRPRHAPGAADRLWREARAAEQRQQREDQ